MRIENLLDLAICCFDKIDHARRHRALLSTKFPSPLRGGVRGGGRVVLQKRLTTDRGETTRPPPRPSRLREAEASLRRSKVGPTLPARGREKTGELRRIIPFPPP